MSLSTKKLQKKRAAKKNKRKTSSKSRTQPSLGLSFYEAVLSSDIWNVGMGIAALAQEKANGGLTLSVFKLDVFCLGVKDAYVADSDFENYHAFKDNYAQGTEDRLEQVDPGYLKILISKSINYAKDLGFTPGGDCDKALQAFQKIKSPIVIPTFKFGRKGAPCYISGPDDSPKMISEIMSKLEKRRGSSAASMDPLNFSSDEDDVVDAAFIMQRQQVEN